MPALVAMLLLCAEPVFAQDRALSLSSVLASTDSDDPAPRPQKKERAPSGRGFALGASVGPGLMLGGDPVHTPGGAYELHVGAMVSREVGLFAQFYGIDVRSGPLAVAIPALAVQYWPGGKTWWLRGNMALLGTNGIQETATDVTFGAAGGKSFWTKGRVEWGAELAFFAQWWDPIGTPGSWYTSMSAGVTFAFGPAKPKRPSD